MTPPIGLHGKAQSHVTLLMMMMTMALPRRPTANAGGGWRALQPIVEKSIAEGSLRLKVAHQRFS